MCGLDADVAAITVESVFRHLYMMGDHENELEDSVSAVLKRTNGNPTVMSLLGRLCDVTQTTRSIDTAIVESRAIDSVSFHDSICMLEGLLLRSASTSSSSSNSTVAALVSLYSKLQLNDVVMSLVSSHASHETTREAVMMEQKCDVRRAYTMYRDLVFKEENMDIENSLEQTWWEEGRLRCMELLQLWSTVYDNSIAGFDVQRDENDLDRDAALYGYMSAVIILLV